MVKRKTLEFIVGVEGTETSVIRITTDRAKWTVKEVKKTSDMKLLTDIEPVESKHEVKHRIAAAKELRKLIDYFAREWVDYEHIKNIVQMDTEEICNLTWGTSAFSHELIFYLQRIHELVTELADKEDKRFNSSEIKQELGLTLI